MSLPPKYDYDKAISAYNNVPVSQISDLKSFFRPVNYLCACYFISKQITRISYPLGGPTAWSTLCPSCMRYYFNDYRASNSPEDLAKGHRALFCVQGGLREWLCQQQGQFFLVQDLQDEMERLVENYTRRDLSKWERKEMREFLRDSRRFEREIYEKTNAVWDLVCESIDRREEENDSEEKLAAMRHDTERVNAEVERVRRKKRVRNGRLATADEVEEREVRWRKVFMEVERVPEEDGGDAGKDNDRIRTNIGTRLLMSP